MPCLWFADPLQPEPRCLSALSTTSPRELHRSPKSAPQAPAACRHRPSGECPTPRGLVQRVLPPSHRRGERYRRPVQPAARPQQGLRRAGPRPSATCSRTTYFPAYTTPKSLQGAGGTDVPPVPGLAGDSVPSGKSFNANVTAKQAFPQRFTTNFGPYNATALSEHAPAPAANQPGSAHNDGANCHSAASHGQPHAS
jgi:hypothetical protein